MTQQRFEHGDRHLADLPKVTDDYEVIVVNDGSPDHTGEMLRELARVYPQVRVISHEKNRGYGAL